MKLLAIETATDMCSCAIRVDGDARSRDQHAPRRHAELILGMGAELLDEADLRLGDLDGIAFGRGPGSFTGVRIAASVVQGLAYGVGLPVVGISSLHALAEGVRRQWEQTHVLAGFDARMSEVYWGVYHEEAGVMIPVMEEGVFAPERVPMPSFGDAWYGAGDGWAAYGEVLSKQPPVRVKRWCASVYPRAIDVLNLAAASFTQGDAVSAQFALPVYLRDTVTRKPGG